MLNKTPYFLSIVFLALMILNPASANAGWSCDWLGIGCSPAETSKNTIEESQVKIDQDNPPEVFSFSMSGTFDKWADIQPQTVICDTREREDRSCALRLYIPDIKRDAVVVLKPFAHDLGMYKLDSLIANSLGRDPDYRTNEEIYLTAYEAESGEAGFFSLFGKVSISALAERKFRVLIFEGGAYSVSKTKDVPVGSVSLNFKDVLK